MNKHTDTTTFDYYTVGGFWPNGRVAGTQGQTHPTLESAREHASYLRSKGAFVDVFGWTSTSGEATICSDTTSGA